MGRRVCVLVLLAAVAAAQEEVRIEVKASRGKIIPLAKGGGWQRMFRFTARSGTANHWIRQVLAVRGSVVDKAGNATNVHYDVVEYYRVGSKGRAIHADTHHSQYRRFYGGNLTVRATLTYGTLRSIKRGDTIMAKSFILRGARDGQGRLFIMRSRKGQIIPAERGERVVFAPVRGVLTSSYAYGVRWNSQSRARPSGALETGTWRVDVPEQDGPTVASARPQAIPRLK